MIRSLFITALFSAIVFGAAPVAEHTITQANKTFSESEISIKAGEKVIFKNDDQVTHNVFSTSKGFEFNLKIQAPGASTSVPFNGAGTAEVRCAIHPKMKLIVHVK